MKSLNIHSVIRRKRFKYYTPKNLDMGKIEDNILNREFNCNSPNQKWVTDITYLKYDNGRKIMYLSAIKDLYNREIIAYKISDSLDISFVDQTLGEAFKNACIENFFGHLKTELIYQNSYRCSEDLINSINDYIHWYNNERFQSNLKI